MHEAGVARCSKGTCPCTSTVLLILAASVQQVNLYVADVYMSLSLP